MFQDGACCLPRQEGYGTKAGHIVSGQNSSSLIGLTEAHLVIDYPPLHRAANVLSGTQNDAPVPPFRPNQMSGVSRSTITEPDCRLRNRSASGVVPLGGALVGFSPHAGAQFLHRRHGGGFV
jgi:hypothetical protein